MYVAENPFRPPLLPFRVHFVFAKAIIFQFLLPKRLFEGFSMLPDAIENENTALSNRIFP